MFKKIKDLIDFYDNQFYLSKNLNRSKVIKPSRVTPGNIGVDPLSTFSKKGVTYYYIVEALPNELPIDFKRRLELSMSAGVRLSMLINSSLHTIDWGSVEMQRRLRALESVRQSAEDSSAYNLHDRASKIKGTSAVEDSLEYLADSSITRGRSLTRTEMFFVVTGERGDAFDFSINSLNTVARNMGIKLKRVTYVIPQFLEYFSPFKRKFTTEMANEVKQFVLTDEILSGMFRYTQGGISSNGTYCGMDIKSGYPTSVKIKEKGDEAEIWLVTAETGGGKSFFVKWLVLAILGEGFNATIMDVEGFEYLKLGEFMEQGGSSVKVINLGEGSGVNYFDPVEIHELTGIKDVDDIAKKMSMSFTVSTLRTMLSDLGKDDPWVNIAVKKLVNYAYKSWGVTEDKDTWKNTRGMSLHDIFKLIPSVPTEGHPPEFKKALGDIKFFLDYHLETSLLGERITVKDIKDADVLICSFGMAGKSEDMVDPIAMVLMQLTATLISYQRSIFSMAKGKFNLKVWEEFQRWGKFPNAEKTIGVALTGGRKLGDFNLVVTNDVKSLLNDDKFSLFGNITSFFLGAIIDSETRTELCKRLSIPEFTGELDKIINAARLVTSKEDKGDVDDSEVFNPYTYAFLAGLKRSKFNVIRLDLPAFALSTGIFKTGITREEEVES
jgi:hypothetical protein